MDESTAFEKASRAYDVMKDMLEMSGELPLEVDFDEAEEAWQVLGSLVARNIKEGA